MTGKLAQLKSCFILCLLVGSMSLATLSGCSGGGGGDAGTEGVAAPAPGGSGIDSSVSGTPPVAEAGIDQSLTLGQTAQLTGAASLDADGDPLSYKWSFQSVPEGSAVSLNDAATLTPSFKPDSPGTYSVQLVVSDGKVESEPSLVDVTVTAQPEAFPAPVLTSAKPNGTSWLLTWSVPGGSAPTGGFNVVVDGTNTGEANRTSGLTTTINGLTAGGQRCFQVEARWLQAEPDQFRGSNQICVAAAGPSPVSPSPSTGGGLTIIPGLQGFGTTTKAGRSGQIIRVTNLNDSGPGSLRAAVEASGARTVVFEVSGRIDLQSNLSVRNPYITIAGQTAPAPGVMITGRTVVVSAHDVLIQHVSIRVGDENKADDSGRTADAIQITGTGAYNVVFDHVSASWAIDELVGIGYGIKDITFSNCLFAEGLNNSVHPKGAHGYGILLGDDSTRISLIGNLLAHAKDRLPRVQGGDFLLVNNVFYNKGGTNFSSIGSNAGIPTRMSAVGNLFLDGLNGSPGRAIATNSSTTASGSAIYHKDNEYPGGSIFSGSYLVGTPPSTAWISGLTYMTDPVGQVKASVLKNSGSRPAQRDAVDARIVSDVANRTGQIIDSQSQVGGFPVLAQNRAPFDGGANPNGDDDKDGYTNLEEVLQQLAAQAEGR